MTKCDQCKKPTPADELTTTTVKTANQTYSSPAEYDEIEICDACVQANEYYSDPFNRAYESARAQGWSD
jgi:hypothetical protein